MKTCIRKLFLLPAVIVGLGLIPAGRMTAQTFTTLYSFTDSSDGENPWVGLILSGNTLYGTTTVNSGTVFKINIDGSGYTTLYHFTGGGGGPCSALILSGKTLYGAASSGGTSLQGSVFAVNTDGTGITNLHSFYGSDGRGPQAGLILSDNTLYGTTGNGGSSDDGTVFKVNTDGSGFTNLHSFAYSADGANPLAGLILSGNTLYGTVAYGGGFKDGTVFAVKTDGTGFTTLYRFSALSAVFSGTNSDGAHPFASLIISSNTLYGTAIDGGSAGVGTMFAIKTDGTGFTNLHTFTGGMDGANPVAGLILSGKTLYGTAQQGGSSSNGTVFAVNTDGAGFTTLHSFTATYDPYYTNSDGAVPMAGLVLSGNTLYGTAGFGGSSGHGTVFSLSLPLPPPPLIIISAGANVILTWPTNATGFALQSTTNLHSPAVWTTVSTGPVVVNGQNAVTNLISGIAKFYRLSQY
jgi:uncharacterized repeat protein (TIGR03803 family)